MVQKLPSAFSLHTRDPEQLVYSPEKVNGSGSGLTADTAEVGERHNPTLLSRLQMLEARDKLSR